MARLCLRIAVAVILAVPAWTQTLTCASAHSADCRTYHFHIQPNRQTTGYGTELYGINRFPTIESCETERTRLMTAEKDAVSFVLRVASRAKVGVSNFGPCHCDMTGDSSSRHYLTDQQRFQQRHLQREITLQLLQEALAKGLSPGDPVAEALAARPSSFRTTMWSATVAPPPDSPHRFLDTGAPSMMATGVSSVPPRQLDTSRFELAQITFGSEIPLQMLAADAGTRGRSHGADFLDAEIAETQSHFLDVLDMEESERRERLVELIQQRIQLLSNLSRLVETAGPSSNLARAMAAAEGSDDRLNLIGTIFGADVRHHWRAERPEDLLLDIPPSVSSDPVAILRDPGRRFSHDDRKLALYVFLLRNGSLTESQEMWLSELVESSLQQTPSGSGGSR